MRIAVVGATGRTGKHVVTQALARGHHVTALARQPARLALRHQNLVSVAADVLDGDSVLHVLPGADAVVSTLGVGASREPTVLYSVGISNILKAMRANGICTVAVVSAAPVAPRSERTFLERRVLMPVLERLFGATYEDMRRMEALLDASPVDWVSLRPPRIVNRPATGSYRVAVSGRLARPRSITYGDLATALLDALDRRDLHGRPALVAN
ncbi:MAG: NAD(P)H-binding protein [Geodermatophilaceae bacterium]|nr:NAD(P)H-binding protein [Geodermatophilaceae bacterium]